MIAIRSGTPRRARLAGLGAHVPPRVVTNDDLAGMGVDTSDEWIASRTGIRERRFADPGQASSDLAILAAERILADAGVAAEDVDTVILPTTTPDHLFPATAAIVAEAIGARRAGAYDLLAACSGFVYGLAQGTALIEAGLATNVLVIGAETFSKIIDFEDRSTCVLFGDGAAGALLTAADPDDTAGFLGFELGADGSGAMDLVLPAGGSRMPVHEVGRREDGYLQMNGREVFRFATRALEESTQRLLEATGLGIDDIDLVIPHQANIRIIEHAVGRLGIDRERVYVDLDRYGNTSAASIPIALTEARDSGRLRPGGRVLMVSFGAGLTWGSAIGHWEPR